MSRLNTLLAATLGLALLGAPPVLADPGKGNGHGKNMQHGNQGHQNPGGGNDLPPSTGCLRSFRAPCHSREGGNPFWNGTARGKKTGSPPLRG